MRNGSFYSDRYDLISLGIDIYNVEAEALGCEVGFSRANSTPSIVTHVLEHSPDCGGLSVPDPETSGRMPLYLKAAEILQAELGQDVLISGTIVGPFTLSALLRGFEQFIMDAIYNTEFFEELMAFSCEVAAAYGSAFVSRGVGITINESWCSPPLISPNLYKSRWEY